MKSAPQNSDKPAAGGDGSPRSIMIASIGLVLSGILLFAVGIRRGADSWRDAAPDQTMSRARLDGRRGSTNIRSGKERQLIVIGSSTCGASSVKGLSAAVQQIRRVLDSTSMHEGTHFSTLGVATDWSITDGLTFLTEFGPFDEIAVGKNWLNMGIQRYVMSELPGEAGLPQLVVTERDVDVGTGAITARHETVIDRRVGANAILLWAASLTPSSTPKVKKEGTVPVSQQSRNPGTSKDG